MFIQVCNFKVYMAFFEISDKKIGEKMMIETPVRAQDQSEDSDLFDSN